MKRGLHFIFAFSFLFLLSSFASAADKWTDFEKNRDDYLEELSKSVFACENRVDTGHPVFHGCIDWHSSVHGYWALLRAVKYTKNGRYRKFVQDALDSPLTETERIYLNTNKNFEMPYGRAWFLRLAIEYRSITGRKDLDPMAGDIAQSLVEFYESNEPAPGVGEYANAEWALRNLRDYGAFTGNKEIMEFVDLNIKRFLKTKINLSLNDDKDAHPEFFSRFGNFFHLLEAASESNDFSQVLKRFPPDDDSMSPIKTFKNAHHLGVNYSRAWGLWSIYKKTGDVKYRDAYLENALAGFNEHKRYKDDYYSYGHWVPQFGIYAITYPFE